VWLSRALGDPDAGYAILAEGNTSARTGDDTFLLKASGFSLAEATPESFVEMGLSAVLALLDTKPRGDEELARALSACRLDDGHRPSVEAALHAVGLALGAARVVGHTHPTEINAILCSQRPELIVTDPLFPDQIVVCGRTALLVPICRPRNPTRVGGAHATERPHRSARPPTEDDLPPEPRANRARAIGR
jgi:rhamnose utilization protein RhaD (predicted bifunctional aldolase and dehydrogenase)